MSKNKQLAQVVYNEMCKVVKSGDVVTHHPELYGGVRITDKFTIENSLYVYMECQSFLAN